jgi:hypothetical protein
MTSRQFKKQIPKRQDILRTQYMIQTRRMQVETIQSQSPSGFESDIVFSRCIFGMCFLHYFVRSDITLQYSVHKRRGY